MFKNKKFGLLLLVLLLVVPMVLVACGDDDKDDKDSKGGDLNQSVEGYGLTVKYPDGWVAKVDEDNGSVVVANKQELLDREDAQFQAGEFGVIVMAMPLADMGVASGREAFDMMVSIMASEGANAPEVKEIKIGDKDGFRADASFEVDSDGFMVGFEADGALVLVAAVSAKGELSNNESTALDIAGSVAYAAPAAE